MFVDCACHRHHQNQLASIEVRRRGKVGDWLELYAECGLHILFRLSDVGIGS
jgi:hypothetical protein